MLWFIHRHNIECFFLIFECVCSCSQKRQNLISRDDWLKSGDWEMDPWIWNKVGLKLSQVDIESAVKPSVRSFKGSYMGRP